MLFRSLPQIYLSGICVNCDEMNNGRLHNRMGDIQNTQKKTYIMALDQGTTSSRCILFDKQGNICSMAQKEFTQIYPQPGWVEHNPMEIWSSQLGVAIESMAVLGITDDQIEAIGITNQRETTILWDKNASPARLPSAFA